MRGEASSLAARWHVPEIIAEKLLDRFAKRTVDLRNEKVK